VKTRLDRAARISAFGIMLCGTLMSSQAYAAWGNDSPWSKKHAEQKRQAALEEADLDKPAVEHMAEPMPVVEELEPIPLAAEPEPVPDTMAPETVLAPMEPEPMEMATEIHDASDIMSLPGSHYAVQVYASVSTSSMDRYKASHGLEHLVAVKTERNGSPMYVLISLHDSRSSADEAASNLEQITGSKPWVRSLKGLQAIVMH